MEFLNKETHYLCIEEDNNLKINGRVAVRKTDITFTGNFNTLENKYCGDFVYYENTDHKVNTAVNKVPSDMVVCALQLLMNTITKVKEKLTSFNLELI